METNVQEIPVHADNHLMFRWNSTAEDFCVFVFMMYATYDPALLALNMKDPSNQEQRARVQQYADAFLAMYQVDFSPYTNFADVMDNSNFRQRLIEVCEYEVKLADRIPITEADTQTSVVHYSNGSRLQVAVRELRSEIHKRRLQMQNTFLS